MSLKKLIPAMLVVFAAITTIAFCFYLLVISILTLVTWSNAFTWDLIIALLHISVVTGIVGGSVMIAFDWDGFKNTNR